MASSERQQWVAERIKVLEAELVALRAEQMAFEQQALLSTSGPVDASQVEQLVGMGFAREKARVALSEHPSLDRALEALLNLQISSSSASSSSHGRDQGQPEACPKQLQLQGMGFHKGDVTSALLAEDGNFDRALQRLLQPRDPHAHAGEARRDEKISHDGVVSIENEEMKTAAAASPARERSEFDSGRASKSGSLLSDSSTPVAGASRGASSAENVSGVAAVVEQVESGRDVAASVAASSVAQACDRLPVSAPDANSLSEMNEAGTSDDVARERGRPHVSGDEFGADAENEIISHDAENSGVVSLGNKGMGFAKVASPVRERTESNLGRASKSDSLLSDSSTPVAGASRGASSADDASGVAAMVKQVESGRDGAASGAASSVVKACDRAGFSGCGVPSALLVCAPDASSPSDMNEADTADDIARESGRPHASGDEPRAAADNVEGLDRGHTMSDAFKAVSHGVIKLKECPALEFRPLVALDDVAGCKLADVMLCPDAQVRESAQSSAKALYNNGLKKVDAQVSRVMHDLIDALSWAARILGASNQQMRQSVASGELVLPAVMAYAMGSSHLAWQDSSTWDTLIDATKNLCVQLWGSNRDQGLSDDIVLKETLVTLEMRRRYPSRRQEKSVFMSSFKCKAKMTKLSLQAFVEFVSSNTAFWDAGPEPEIPELRLEPGAAARLSTHDFGGHLIDVLREVQCAFLRLQTVRPLVKDLQEAYGKLERKDRFTIGERASNAELRMRLGIKPIELLAKLGGVQPWQALPDISLEKPLVTSRSNGFCLERPPCGLLAHDPLAQMRALDCVGKTVVRKMLTEAEMVEVKGDASIGAFGIQRRIWWYCNSCSTWYNVNDSRYSRDLERSHPTYHVCGENDANHVSRRRDVTPRPQSTAKPNHFEIRSGMDLGLTLHVREEEDARLRLLLSWPLEEVLRVLDFAAGMQANSVRASVRLANALEPDEPVEAIVHDELDTCEDEQDDSVSRTPDSKRRRTKDGNPPSASSLDGGPGDSVDQSPHPKRQKSSSGPLGSPGSLPHEETLARRAVDGAKHEPAALPSGKDLKFSLLPCRDGQLGPACPGDLKQQLHDLQRRTLFWMASREGVLVPGFAAGDTAFEGFSSTHKITRRLGASDVSAQLSIERLYSHAMGGILADAVGYGKTASVLGLVALSSKQDLVSHEETVGQRFASRATLVLVPSNLHAQWMSEIGKFFGSEHSLKVVSLATFADIKKVSVGDLRDADIVVATWRVLVSKAYQEHFDVISRSTSERTLSAREQYEKALNIWNGKDIRWQSHLRWQGILGAAKAKAPPQPGRKPIETDFSDKTIVKNHGDVCCATRQAQLDALLAELRSRPGNTDALRAPVLEVFHWKRLVVDELHEVLKLTQDGVKGKGEGLYLFHALENLRATSRWGLTATPNLESASSVAWMARFNQVFVPGDSVQEAQHYLDQYVRSNSVDESGIPVEYHMLPVRHTAVERALYLNYANQAHTDPCRLLQYCSFFSPVGQDVDADAAVVTARTANEKNLEKHRADMAAAKSELELLDAQAALGFPSALNEEEINRLRDKRKRLHATWPDRVSKERELVSRVRYFEEMLSELQKLESEDIECPMCLDPMRPEKCSVTVCGHLFCTSCLEESVAVQKACPTCRRELEPTQLQRAVDVLELSKDASVSDRIKNFGSKLNAVCNQLEAIWAREPEAKVIIFLQFEVLLRKAEAALIDMSFPCLTLKGSIFERRKTIRLFHAPGQKHRVLLASLEKSPSGMNLVCCHHLILVHPMYAESRETALGYERQALGRVRRRGQEETVHVYRFYTRDTVEEKLTSAHHQELSSRGGESSFNGNASSSSSSSKA